MTRLPPWRKRRDVPRTQALAAFGANRTAEDRYAREMRAVSRSWEADVLEELAPGGADPFTVPALTTDAAGPLDLQNRLRAAADRIANEIPKRVRAPFDAMAKRIVGAGYKAAREVLAIDQTDLGIDSDIHEARERNIALMTDAGRAYAAHVGAVLRKPENQGAAWTEIKRQIQARGDVSDSRAELIARDQVLKLNASIAETRMKNAGVTEYKWSTSHDERVRPDHALLDGQTFRFDSPPVVDKRTGRRENPGQDFQCRCVAIPVIAELEGLGLQPGTYPQPLPKPAPPPRPSPAPRPRAAPKPPPAPAAPAPLPKATPLTAAQAQEVLPAFEDARGLHPSRKSQQQIREFLRDAVRRAGLPAVRPEMIDADAYVSDHKIPNGVDGTFNLLKGKITVRPRQHERLTRGLAFLAKGQPMGMEEAQALRVVVHETVHGVRALPLDAYQGASAVIEEMTTEIEAQRITSELTGHPAPPLHLMAYGSDIQAVRDIVGDVAEAHGMKLDEDASIRAAARAYKSLAHKPQTADSVLEDWLGAVTDTLPKDTHPEKRSEFLRALRIAIRGKTL